MAVGNPLRRRRRLGSTPTTPNHRRCPIAPAANPHAAQVTFVDGYPLEHAAIRAARTLSYEVGIEPVPSGTGAALRLLAGAGAAKAVVEIGTGTGTSGLWLLQGMRTDGILTTIDVEPEHQRMARRIFAEAGYQPSRTRIITGRALDVLPRLADGVYDLLFVDGDPEEYSACVAAAARLLRRGGMLVVNGALTGGRVADPAARDPRTVLLREVIKAVRDAEEWISALLPVGDGLLAAVRC
jgi:predicted O-methyltransferase YrrM